MLESSNSSSKLILVLISNVLDLKVKLDHKFDSKSHSKLASRMKFQTIMFNPYSHLQIREIIIYKYPGIRAMMFKDAITFIAKKIANVNSDIRLLEKIYTRIRHEFEKNGGHPLDTEFLNGLFYEEYRLPNFLAPYAGILKILYRAGRDKESRKR